MSNIGGPLLEFVSHLLQRDEREVVLGDLSEAGESAWSGLSAVIGLIVRREAALWKNWRPWLAAFGIALPGSLVLMGLSIAVSRSYRQFLDPGPGFSLLLCNVLLLAGWSWTGGFVVGSVSRRTLWISAALCFAPCVFCLSRFRVESLSRFCLLVFLLPAVWGVYRGLQIARIRLGAAVILAVGVTVLTIPAWSSGGPWIPNWALSWPAWYLVATARRSGC
ncbi:MAG: hypothetical protein ABJF23_13995 [Bryobacteraceae bacterium]